MNDRHPSGNQDPTGSAADSSYGSHPGYEQHGQQDAQLGYTAYDGYTTGTYDTGAYAAGTYDTGTFDTGTYDVSGAYDAYGATAYDTGAYDTVTYGGGTYDTGTYATGYETGAYDPYAYPSYDATGTYDVSDVNAAYDTGTYDVSGAYDTGTYDTGSYDTVGGAWPAAEGYEAAPQDAQFETGQFETGQFETGQFEATQYGTGHFDTGQYEAVAGQYEAAAESTAVFTVDELVDPEAGTGDAADEDLHSAATAIIPAPTLSPEAAPEAAPGGRRARREAQGNSGRGRRRTPKKSALLTVAVPSVAAMGVCAVAAASVSGATDKDEDTAVQAASEASAVKPSAANNKLDSQLSNLSADANDFADRASRTQERLDLQAREAAEKKRRAEEAARKEALRPKFALPVKQHGLSALFGQAGVNWMSLHSGIDFPVSYGTPVMAATDGTVVTKWNPAYGNMIEVTAPDGTETWYCHLSSAKIRSGTVKAGDVIGYSGNSGNSTGPHLHFEVHPDGGDAIDPLPWLRSHGINPN
ncbi:peptidoglycan DD-metalloendopeptidase family protein [Streptomyces violens]|uniref:peptidoglycan DD-metalloendopeptidase family protein n=1 Tax=Streptomyces violens TaxID=66377 RepID=UPI0004C12BAA|nr:peptidoglycan DD-metalloendopeptidase family protein [Streptomyces violens]